MRHRHDKAEILDAALATASADGLNRLSFGRVAARLGINDRTVVYYFPTKDDLVREVLESVGLDLQHTLGEAFAAPAADHLALARMAWPVLTSGEADPVFALFFEACGLAAAGLPPYATIVPLLLEGWIAWVAELIEGSAEARLVEAAALVALVDGLLLIRQLVGDEHATRAARALGVV